MQEGAKSIALDKMYMSNGYLHIAIDYLHSNYYLHNNIVSHQHFIKQLQPVLKLCIIP